MNTEPGLEERIHKLETELKQVRIQLNRLEGLIMKRQKDIDQALQQSDPRFYSKDPHSPF